MLGASVLVAIVKFRFWPDAPSAAAVVTGVSGLMGKTLWLAEIKLAIPPAGAGAGLDGGRVVERL